MNAIITITPHNIHALYIDPSTNNLIDYDSAVMDDEDHRAYCIANYITTLAALTKNTVDINFTIYCFEDFIERVKAYTETLREWAINYR